MIRREWSCCFCCDSASPPVTAVWRPRAQLRDCCVTSHLEKLWLITPRIGLTHKYYKQQAVIEMQPGIKTLNKTLRRNRREGSRTTRNVTQAVGCKKKNTLWANRGWLNIIRHILSQDFVLWTLEARIHVIHSYWLITVVDDVVDVSDDWFLLRLNRNLNVDESEKLLLRHISCYVHLTWGQIVMLSGFSRKVSRRPKSRRCSCY